MDLTDTTQGIEVSTAPAGKTAADLLIVPVFEDDDPLEDVAALDLATGGQVSRARAAHEFCGRLFDLFLTPVVDDSWRPARVALIGAGPRADWTTERLRRLAAAAGLAARQRHVASIAFLDRSGFERAQAVQAIVEGLVLGEFDPGQYKTGESRAAVPAACVVWPGAELAVARAAVHRGRVLGENCNLARAFANEPANLFTPRVFAERAAELARQVDLAVDLLDERRIAELDMGLLLGVSRGSAEPPRVIVLRYDPPGVPAQPVLGLVGKGITFDTGGISIKPADGMNRMKDDMAGGAAVLCAMRAIAILNAPVRVVGVIPSTENMPGGGALKPGDVLRSASGKTVEVLNTDAEGRLILGDGLWYARELGATHLVDVATLTGSCIVALGKMVSGLFGSPDAWAEQVRRAATRAGERCWLMPMPADYLEELRSDVADLANSGGRPAGAITAALFLREFTSGLPWAHLDIAGTAWLDEAKPFQPKGPTGVAVRTLAELAFMTENWPV